MYRRRYLSSCPLELPVTLLRVQFDESACVGERDGRDLEGCLLGRDEVPGLEGSLELCAGMALRSHEHTFSHVPGRDHQDMSVAAIWSRAFAMARLQAGPGAIW